MAITIVYPVGDPAPVTLTLPGSSWGEESGYCIADDIKRAIDGSLFSTLAFRKRHKLLKWDYLTYAQKASLELLFSVGCPFTFADVVDTDNQFTALMVGVPVFRQEAYGYWSGDVEVQEI